MRGDRGRVCAGSSEGKDHSLIVAGELVGSDNQDWSFIAS